MPHPVEKSPIKRKIFKFDLASHWCPAPNPEPTTARGRRRRESGGATPKVPGELVVGLAHRPHSHPSKLPSGPTIKGHCLADTHARLQPLTRTYKKSSH